LLGGFAIGPERVQEFPLWDVVDLLDDVGVAGFREIVSARFQTLMPECCVENTA
jgi:hypothetical protein